MHKPEENHESFKIPPKVPARPTTPPRRIVPKAPAAKVPADTPPPKRPIAGRMPASASGTPVPKSITPLPRKTPRAAVPSPASVATNPSAEATAPAGEVPVSAKEAAAKKPMRKGLGDLAAPSRTISQSYYRRLIIRLRRRQWVQSLVVLGVAGVGFLMYLLVALPDVSKSEILIRINQGLVALQEDRLEDAQRELEASLDLFQAYNPTPSERSWNKDRLVYTNMLRVGEGFRSLGESDNALETYRQLAVRNIQGPDSWLGQELRGKLTGLIDSERWTEEERKALYQSLLNAPTETWKKNDLLLVVTTEMAGLRLEPMSERYPKATLIAYGLPSPMQSLNDETFRVQGKRYYRVDRLSSAIEFKIPSTMGEAERKRLEWYSRSGRACLVFGREAEGRMMLNGIEGVLLSDTHTVPDFDQQVMQDES